MAETKCTYCQNPILTCRIKCVECSDFDLCLQCFACGVEAGPHRKEHDYKVEEDGTFNVFDKAESWTSGDEDLLLDGVEQYGFGNWEDVSKHVKTKPSEECKDHYFTYYLHGNVGKVSFTASQDEKKVIDHTCPEGGPLSPSLTRPLPPLDLSIPEQQELGYMPLRDDFEREYDNEAESLVSSLSLNYDDEDLDSAFKVAQADMYRYRLKERERRKQIAREFNVMQNATTTGMKRLQANKKKLSKDEKEFQDKMRVFAQFHASTDHEQFFENLQKEKKVKLRIKELMRYRRNGITKMDECAEYDTERVKREKRKETKKKLGNSNLLVRKTSMASKKEKGEDDDVIITNDCKLNGSRDIASFTGFNLLSEREKKLCHSIGMKPASYVTIKTCIIKDYLQRRQGMHVKIRYPSHLDKTHRRKILNFLSESGWIGGIGTIA